MKIVHVVSEFAPLVKVGGMGDALLGLARAQMEKGHDVTVWLPKYSIIDVPCKKLQDFAYSYDGVSCANTLWMTNYEKIPIILVETKTPHKFFQRERIYGEADDADRFAYFCKLIAAYFHSRVAPDCLHVHDWHTALVPLLYQKCTSILTIHNLAYPGACGLDTLKKIELDDEKIEMLRLDDHYSLLKGGILAAHHVTTVSPTYAKEILTPEFGGPFCSLLNQQRQKLSGILNGIDYTYWNPESDPHLPIHYNLKTLDKKKQLKRDLQEKLKLSQEGRFLVSAIARLVPQKGPKLIEAALRKTVKEGGQFILLGAVSDKESEQHFVNLKEEYKSHPHVFIDLTYNERLAHIVFAASDLLIVPSLFEPCGLTQMIAMRYGTVPLVRKTGGLADTVFDNQNGYTFEAPTQEAIEATLERTFCDWQEPSRWHQLIQNGMQSDFSWKRPAHAYLELYQKSLPLPSS